MNTDLATSIFAYILGFQTILLIVLILRQKQRSTSYKLLVLMLSFYLLSLLNLANFYILLSLNYSDWILFLQLELLFGFGPSLYLYTKSLTDQSYQFRKKELIHFIPAILEFIYYRSTFFRQGASSLSESVNSLSSIVFHGIQWGGLISVIIYLSTSIYLLFQYRKWIKDNYSDLEKKKLSWYEKPVILYSVFWLVWISLRVSDIVIFNDTIRPYYFNLGFIFLAILTLWIGFKGYMKAQMKVSGFLSTNSAPLKEEIDLAELQQIAKVLKRKMEEGKFYLESDLTLAKLSTKTAYTERDISRALNNCLQLNFHEFVNQYRVEAFKENLQRKEFSHLSLLGIALESGFGSKSTFNLVFKTNTGMTPTQYSKKITQNKS